MSWDERLQCALLLALVTVPLSISSLKVTSYPGWPALGFAVALFLVAGPTRRWYVAGIVLVVITPALSHGYGVSIPLGAIGSLSVVLPALLTSYLLGGDRAGGLRLDEVDNKRYHAVTGLSAALTGVAGAAGVTLTQAADSAWVAGLMSFLAALTAQLVVLPLIIQTAGRPGLPAPAS